MAERTIIAAMVNASKRALVFDSGVGGLSVLDAIVASGVALEIDYVADNAWLPYGLKRDDDLRARVPALLARLIEQWRPHAIVLACNTASTIALDAVRAVAGVPVIGVVPPIKPAAALSRTGVIGLLATPATVQRAYTDALIAEFAAAVVVVRAGSTALVDAAEQKLRGVAPDPRVIAEAAGALFASPDGERIDVVALACTHFPLLAQELAAASPRRVAWLDSGEAVARRLAQVLALELGRTSMRNVGFTHPAAAGALAAAFQGRGFLSFAAIGDAPGYLAIAKS